VTSVPASVDARTGAELFALRFQWPMFSRAILSSPAIVDDTLYVGSADGYLYAIS